jgi:hypothetical protein
MSSCRNVFCRSLPDVALDALLDELLVDEALFVPFIVSSSVCETVAPLLPIVVLVVKEVLLRFRS